MKIDPPTTEDSELMIFPNITKIDSLFADDMHLFLQNIFEQIQCNENLTQKRFNVIDNWTKKVTTLLDDDDASSTECTYDVSFIEPAKSISVPGQYCSLQLTVFAFTII